ncbi:MAG: S8 family serine peptidase [Akkermansiaceae bacterium]
MHRRQLLISLGFLATVTLGYWVARSAAPPQAARNDPAKAAAAPPRSSMVDEPAARFRKADRATDFRSDREANDAGALPGQRVLVFKDLAALEDFLKGAGDQIRILGRLDALNALRVGFLNYDDLAALLGGDELASFVFPVDVPAPNDGAVQPGAVALGDRLLEWLGIVGDNSAWGSGVRIAVLDTGVAAHPAFSKALSWLNLVALPGDITALNGHGTAVASVIVGNDPLTPGVAPGSEIFSIRIANDLGQSDSFLLAKGIIAAVDAGAQLINISMGSFGDSALVRSAIEYARASGALIIAASGNNGLERVTYPAANDGVIAVGSVDALGNHLEFSNTGRQLSISAPGFGVNAAWPGNQAASVSGTSFSTPVVSGAIAALMSQPGAERLSPQQAWTLLSSHLNDGGEAGTDPALGAGMPDIGRVLNRATPGIYDAAVASQRIMPPSPGFANGQVEILIQNRGTERLINTGVQVATPFGTVSSNITTLAPNAVQTIRLPIQPHSATALRYASQVQLSGGLTDAKPSNDRRAETYVPAPVD